MSHHTKEADLVDFVHVFSSVIQSQGCKTMCGDNLASTPPEYQTIAQPDSAFSDAHFRREIDDASLDHLCDQHSKEG